MMKLLESAASMPGVEVFGSTPYVEKDGNYEKQIQNIEFAIKTAQKYNLHLDFHIDYNLDLGRKAVVLDALNLLAMMGWPSDQNEFDHKSVAFGHCTRITMFDSNEWLELCENVGELPVSFVGLPTSDLFMMGRPGEEQERQAQMFRGTLQVIQMIKTYGLNAAIGINNIGNAFTPYGNCDPLSLASFGVGIYQVRRSIRAEILRSQQPARLPPKQTQISY